MKKYLVLFLLSISSMVFAIPTIMVPNLKMDYDAVNADKMNTTNVNGVVYKKIPKFSSNIRGALISSGKFKVLNTKKLPDISASVAPVVESHVSLDENANYYLVGSVYYVDENEDSYPIEKTDNISMVYSFEVGANFKLVRAKDNVIMASFSANGIGRDTKIINSQKMTQTKWHHNYAKITEEANTDLAKNVLTQMLEQFNFVNDNEQKEREENEPKVVTDVKVYN